ncbi:hypothetical protein B4064_2930 [Caldibacillus thermoamylovorans]|nr:hypothetical protein B4064_2930 [Caldibacillus thermoamylovorans]
MNQLTIGIVSMKTMFGHYFILMLLIFLYGRYGEHYYMEEGF